jgi:hypothetical protein
MKLPVTVSFDAGKRTVRFRRCADCLSLLELPSVAAGIVELRLWDLSA